MEEGYDFVWRKNSAPYFVRPDGKAVILKLDGRVPYVDDQCEVIASESAMPVALAASDQKIGRVEEASSSSGGRPSPDAALFPLRPDEVEPPEPEFDPELEDNPEVAEAPKPMSKRSKEMMMREAKSEEHLFTHRPKNLFCETCVRSKMQAPQARRRHGSSSVDAKAFGDHVTADHVISNDETYGFKGEWNALVVKDVFTQFRYFYPSARQDADSCVRAFQHFTKPDDHVGIFYSDNSGEIAAAVKSMDWRHVLSQPYVSQSSGVIEREIRTILEGARANLFQSGLPVELWPLAFGSSTSGICSQCYNSR